jgi:hypothetical protein
MDAGLEDGDTGASIMRRVGVKLCATASLTAIASLHHAISKRKSIRFMLVEFPRQVLGYSTAMALFCGELKFWFVLIKRQSCVFVM